MLLFDIFYFKFPLGKLNCQLLDTKTQIFITFYLVSKSLVWKFLEKQKPTIFLKLIDWKKMKHYESKAKNIFYAVNLFIVATSLLTADLLALAFWPLKGCLLFLLWPLGKVRKCSAGRDKA